MISFFERSPAFHEFLPPITGQISLGRFRPILESVWGYLEQLAEEYKARSDKDAGLFYRVRTHNMIERQFNGLKDLATVQETINQIMQIYFSANLSQGFGNRYFLSQFTSTADIRGYYCKELRITPLGPDTQRYDAICWRDPPQPQASMRGSALWMARGNSNGAERLLQTATQTATVMRVAPLP